MRLIACLGLVCVLFQLTVAVAAEEKRKSEKQLQAAEKLVRSRNYDAALVILDNLLKEEKAEAPIYVKILYQKAYILEQKKKTPEAIEAYNQCLEILVEAEDTNENRKLLDKCKKAVLKLDKSRRIILRHADMIEKEAAKYKDRDEYTYNKMMEVVEMMRGAWDKKGETASTASDSKVKAAITKRFRDFYGTLATGGVDKAIDYVDPQIVRQAGEAVVKGYLHLMEGMLKLGRVQKNDIYMKEIVLGKDKTDAKVIGRLRLPDGTKDMDPNYWIKRNGTWYLGDDKELKKKF